MKKIIFSFLLFVLGINLSGYCDENDSWDEYYTEQPYLIEWEGHIWEPFCLMHSSKCPCFHLRKIKDCESVED